AFDLLHDLRERPERDALPIGEAVTGDHTPAVGNRSREFIREPRLSDARWPDDGRDHAFPLVYRTLESVFELLHLMMAADERAVAAAMIRREFGGNVKQ